MLRTHRTVVRRRLLLSSALGLGFSFQTHDPGDRGAVRPRTEARPRVQLQGLQTRLERGIRDPNTAAHVDTCLTYGNV